MKGDFSRLSWPGGGRYSQLMLQQGRMVLDADWNTQIDALTELRAAALSDIIGPMGILHGGALVTNTLEVLTCETTSGPAMVLTPPDGQLDPGDGFTLEVTAYVPVDQDIVLLSVKDLVDIELITPPFEHGDPVQILVTPAQLKDPLKIECDPRRDAPIRFSFAFKNDAMSIYLAGTFLETVSLSGQSAGMVSASPLAEVSDTTLAKPLSFVAPVARPKTTTGESTTPSTPSGQQDPLAIWNVFVWSAALTEADIGDLVAGRNEENIRGLLAFIGDANYGNRRYADLNAAILSFGGGGTSATATSAVQDKWTVALGAGATPTDGLDFWCTAGRIYLDGHMSLLPHAQTYLTQLGSSMAEFPIDQDVIVYAETWPQFTTDLQTPQFADPALGGADTVGRVSNTLQLRVLQASDTSKNGPAAKQLNSGRLGPAGKMSAKLDDTSAYGLENQLYRIEVHSPGFIFDETLAVAKKALAVPIIQDLHNTGWWQLKPASEKDALLDTLASARAVLLIGDGASESGSTTEDVRYVTEVSADGRSFLFDKPVPSTGAGKSIAVVPIACWKWSRDNGIHAYPVSAREIEAEGYDELVQPTALSLTSEGFNGFDLAPHDFVELTNDIFDLKRRPGKIGELYMVDPGNLTLVVDFYHEDIGQTTLAPFAHPVLRRWNTTERADGIHTCLRVAEASSWTTLEKGIQILFERPAEDETSLRTDLCTGEYWTLPVRESAPNLSWPEWAGTPNFVPPHGPVTRVAPLAQVDGSDVQTGLRVQVNPLQKHS